MIDPATLKSWKTRLAVPFWSVLLLDLVARGQALFAPMASIDSYDVARRSFGGEIAYCLGDGRFVRAALWWAQQQLGFLPLESMSASLCLAIPLFIVSGFLFAAAILDDLEAGEAVVFAALFTLHPFATEYFYYGEVAFATVLAVFFASVAVWSAFRAPPSLVSRCVAVGAVLLALGDYQITIGHIAAGGLLVLAARLARGDKAQGAELLAFARSAGVLALGVILYLLCLVATRFLFPAAAAGRAFPGHVPDFAAKLDAVGGAIGFALWPPNGIVAPAVSLLTLLALALCLAALVRSALAARGLLQALAVALAVGAAILCAACAALIGDVVWLVPRLLSPIALCVAGLAAIGFRRLAGQVRLGLAAAVAIVLLGYLGADASILFDQRRVNLWDDQEANRMIARLEADPGFGKATSLAIVGRKPTRPLALSTMSGDMNSSAFGSPWSKLGLVEQATGYRFLAPTDEEWQAAIDYCAGRAAWPTPGSAAVKDELAIVCLPRR
jgi:glucosyltransferase GtrII-like protein